MDSGATQIHKASNKKIYNYKYSIKLKGRQKQIRRVEKEGTTLKIRRCTSSESQGIYKKKKSQRKIDYNSK